MTKNVDMTAIERCPSCGVLVTRMSRKMKIKKIMLLSRDETIIRIKDYESELLNNEGPCDIDFLRKIEEDLEIDIYDVKMINIFGNEYLKILYYEWDFSYD